MERTTDAKNLLLSVNSSKGQHEEVKGYVLRLDFAIPPVYKQYFLLVNTFLKVRITHQTEADIYLSKYVLTKGYGLVGQPEAF